MLLMVISSLYLAYLRHHAEFASHTTGQQHDLEISCVMHWKSSMLCASAAAMHTSPCRHAHYDGDVATNVRVIDKIWKAWGFKPSLKLFTINVMMRAASQQAPYALAYSHTPRTCLDVQGGCKHDVPPDGGGALLEFLFQANVTDHL